ncbi:MAG: hypothetical protein KC594_08415, partial [Nitrospira sp.]|nr:hypothetical protein [Nitrospira sp.]
RFKKVLAHLPCFSSVEHFIMRGKGPLAKIMSNASQAARPRTPLAAFFNCPLVGPGTRGIRQCAY